MDPRFTAEKCASCANEILFSLSLFLPIQQALRWERRNEAILMNRVRNNNDQKDEMALKRKGKKI